MPSLCHCPPDENSFRHKAPSRRRCTNHMGARSSPCCLHRQQRGNACSHGCTRIAQRPVARHDGDVLDDSSASPVALAALTFRFGPRPDTRTGAFPTRVMHVLPALPPTRSEYICAPRRPSLAFFVTAADNDSRAAYFAERALSYAPRVDPLTPSLTLHETLIILIKIRHPSLVWGKPRQQ